MLAARPAPARRFLRPDTAEAGRQGGGKSGRLGKGPRRPPHDLPRREPTNRSRPSQAGSLMVALPEQLARIETES